MSEQPRDWDKELAAIDKVMAKSSAPGAPPGAPAPRSAALPQGVAVGRRAAFGTWLRVVLGLVLAAAMTQWPYSHDCGLNLFAYLGAVTGVIVAGLWSGVSSWYRRLGMAHTLSLLVTLWGLALLAREALPRLGYTKIPLYWLCH